MAEQPSMAILKVCGRDEKSAECRCRCKVYDEGVVSEALARAVAFQENSYDRMLMGRRPDLV